VALLKKKFGAHLKPESRSALDACRPYPPAATLFNPLTRALARRLLEADWKATLEQVDRPYAFEDFLMDGVNCVRVTTPNAREDGPVVLYVHAGAFVAGSTRANAAAIIPACDLAGAIAIGVDYTLAPDGVFPQQIDEVERVYAGLLRQGVNPQRIVVVGDSAGGSISLAAVNRWREKWTPAPAGVVAVSPVTDGAGLSDTHVSLNGRDPIFGQNSNVDIRSVFSLYAPDMDPLDPRVSPLYADYRNAPPMLIQVGARDVLLGDAARLAERARLSGVDVTLQVFDGMFHLFHMHWSLDEAKAAQSGVAKFIRRVTRADAARPSSQIKTPA
jgi:acetyl esterase/lipase